MTLLWGTIALQGLWHQLEQRVHPDISAQGPPMTSNRAQQQVGFTALRDLQWLQESSVKLASTARAAQMYLKLVALQLDTTAMQAHHQHREPSALQDFTAVEPVATSSRAVVQSQRDTFAHWGLRQNQGQYVQQGFTVVAPPMTSSPAVLWKKGTIVLLDLRQQQEPDVLQGSTALEVQPTRRHAKLASFPRIQERHQHQIVWTVARASI